MEGWGEEKYRELKAKIVLHHRVPTREEQRFVDGFPLWQKAKGYADGLGEPAPAKGGESQPAPKEVPYK